MARTRLCLFGGFRADGPDGLPVALPTRKTEALLAFLGSRAGRPQSRDALAGLLWGDRGEPQARHSLSQALSAIRAAFGESIRLAARGRETVTLHMAGACLDVADFQRLAVGDSPDELLAAAGLYGGPLLDGFHVRSAAFEEWLAVERTRLNSLAIAVLTRLAEHQLACGDRDGATWSCHRAQALDPLSEETHRRTMRLHLAHGAYNTVIRHYRSCADILRRELGTSPEPSTVELYRRATDLLARQPPPPAAAVFQHRHLVITSRRLA